MSFATKSNNVEGNLYFIFFKIVLFDQRGSGKSTPLANLEDNTTWHLVEDTEKIKKHLGISTWVVFGGSWGATLVFFFSSFLS